MYRIDERDLAIIKAKERDPMVPVSTIAAEGNFPLSSLNTRHHRLVDRGILKYRVEVDREKLAEAS